jgi:hypothetical protein
MEDLFEGSEIKELQYLTKELAWLYKVQPLKDLGLKYGHLHNLHIRHQVHNKSCFTYIISSDSYYTLVTKDKKLNSDHIFHS